MPLATRESRWSLAAKTLTIKTQVQATGAEKCECDKIFTHASSLKSHKRIHFFDEYAATEYKEGYLYTYTEKENLFWMLQNPVITD